MVRVGGGSSFNPLCMQISNLDFFNMFTLLLVRVGGGSLFNPFIWKSVKPHHPSPLTLPEWEKKKKRDAFNGQGGGLKKKID